MYELSFSCGRKFVFLHLTFCTQIERATPLINRFPDYPLDKVIQKHNVADSL